MSYTFPFRFQFFFINILKSIPFYFQSFHISFSRGHKTTRHYSPQLENNPSTNRGQKTESPDAELDESRDIQQDFHFLSQVGHSWKDPNQHSVKGNNSLIQYVLWNAMQFLQHPKYTRPQFHLCKSFKSTGKITHINLSKSVFYSILSVKNLSCFKLISQFYSSSIKN